MHTCLQVRKGQYADLRFNDGVYLRLPYQLAAQASAAKGADFNFVLEFGAFRLDKGMQRLVALGRRDAGVHTVSFESFS